MRQVEEPLSMQTLKATRCSNPGLANCVVG